MGSEAVGEIRRAAVLGAGVMGAQIAAHLVNAGVPVWLFDLPAKDGDRTGIARRAILRRSRPPASRRTSGPRTTTSTSTASPNAIS